MLHVYRSTKPGDIITNVRHVDGVNYIPTDLMSEHQDGPQDPRIIQLLMDGYEIILVPIQ